MIRIWDLGGYLGVVLEEGEIFLGVFGFWVCGWFVRLTLFRFVDGLGLV